MSSWGGTRFAVPGIGSVGEADEDGRSPSTCHEDEDPAFQAGSSESESHESHESSASDPSDTEGESDTESGSESGDSGSGSDDAVRGNRVELGDGSVICYEDDYTVDKLDKGALAKADADGQKDDSRPLNGMKMHTSFCQYAVVRRMGRKLGAREVSETANWSLYWYVYIQPLVQNGFKMAPKPRI